MPMVLIKSMLDKSVEIHWTVMELYFNLSYNRSITIMPSKTVAGSLEQTEQ